MTNAIRSPSRKIGPPHKVAGGVGDGGGSKPWSEVTALTQLGKACGDGRGTLRTNGTIANGAELQKFDCNQNSDVFLIKTAEAKRTTLLTNRGRPRPTVRLSYR